MITLITALLGSVFSGGATGLLGIGLQRWFDHKAKSQDLELVRINHLHAKELAQIEAATAARAAQAQEQVAASEAAAAERVAQLDAEARADEAAARSLMASYAADRGTYLDGEAQKQSGFARVLMAIVDFVRGLIRPVATVYLLGVATAMFVWVRDKQGAALTADQAHEITMQIVQTLLYLATVATVWWFGTRPPSRPSK